MGSVGQSAEETQYLPWGDQEPAASIGRKDLVPRRNACATRNLPLYQLYSNLYYGRIHNPPDGTLHPKTGSGISTYLIRHEKEPRQEFEERAAAAFTLPYPRDIIRLVTATLFRQETVRDVAEEALTREHLRNVDGRGHGARWFVRQAFIKAQVSGWVGAMTDAPSELRPVPTSWHAERDGRAPYSWLVDAQDLWDWEKDPDTGDFLLALIHDGEEMGPEGPRPVWSWWTPEWVARVDHEGAIISARPHALGVVPLTILTCDEVQDTDPHAPFGLSALADIGDLALHIYQMCSLLEAHEREAMFSFLHVGAEPPKGKAQAANLHVGNAHYIWCDGSVSWVEPPRSVPEEARAQVLWAHQQMRQAAGVSTRSEESQEAHSGVAIIWESSDKHAMIHERGLNLESFEGELWRLHGRILGRDVPRDCVRYPRDFVVHSVDEELRQLERVVGLFGGWSSTPPQIKPYLERKLRRLVVRDMGHLPEVDELLAALDFSEEDEDEPEEGPTMPLSAFPQYAQGEPVQ